MATEYPCALRTEDNQCVLHNGHAGPCSDDASYNPPHIGEAARAASAFYQQAAESGRAYSDGMAVRFLRAGARLAGDARTAKAANAMANAIEAGEHYRAEYLERAASKHELKLRMDATRSAAGTDDR